MKRPELGLIVLPFAVLLFEGAASSDAPVGQYTLTTNTALDTRTGLRWMRGYAPGGSAGSQTWSSGAQACQGLTLDGFTGWRLPTTRELDSLYDWRKSSGQMWDATVFEAAPAWGAITLWSSTEVVDDPTQVEARSFLARAYQHTSRNPRAKSDYAGVRCVRDP
jgi:hypothetical protein